MRRSPALAALLLALLLAAGPAAGRQEPPRPEVTRLQGEERDAQMRARRLRADAVQARAELEPLRARLATLRAEAEAEDSRIVAQRARLAELNAREARLAVELVAARGDQARVLSSLARFSRDPPPALLIPAEQAIDATRAAILMKAVAPELERRVAVIRIRQDNLARVRRLAALSSAELFTLESRRLDRRAEIDAMSARRLQLAAVLEAEAAEAGRVARALQARLRVLGARPLPPPEGEGTATIQRLPGGRARLERPVEGAPGARFGDRSGGWRWSRGGEVRAPADATVAHIGRIDGFGPVMILDLGPGWRAVIGGVDTPAVSEGQRVEGGQTLGRAGEEVYFELRREERPIDPAPWLD